MANPGQADPPIIEYAPEYYDSVQKGVRGTIRVSRGIPYKPPTIERTAPPVVDYYTPPASTVPVVVAQQQPGFQLSTTHLLIGAAILLFLFKGK